MIVSAEDCAVAFIDVLGFAALVHRAHRNHDDATRLAMLMKLLAEVVPGLDAKVDRSVVTTPMIPQFMQFSDSIVLVAPLRVSAKPYYNGLEIVAMRCIQVAHIALQNGYLFRGGIDVGPIFRIGTNIAGRAFMNAYAIEKATKRTHGLPYPTRPIDGGVRTAGARIECGSRSIELAWSTYCIPPTCLTMAPAIGQLFRWRHWSLITRAIWILLLYRRKAKNSTARPDPSGAGC